MTHPLAALIAGVPRYYCGKHGYEDHPQGKLVLVSDVLAALEAAPVPDLGEALAKAEKVETDLVLCLNGSDHVIEDAADTIRSLIALATAQAAQIAGLTKARDDWKRRAIEAEAFRNPIIGDWWREQGRRAEAAEAKVAELEAQIAEFDESWAEAQAQAATLRDEVERLRGALQAFKDFDDLPTIAKRPDVFELRVRQPILRALEEEGRDG